MISVFLDINLCDFFLWGYLKDAFFRKNPRTLDQAKEIICGECVVISLITLQKISANCVLRLRLVIAADDGHFKIIAMGFLSVKRF
ncbi:hypothetical protein TNCT_300931 [Trichonephila clavata]|uniref:Uncharacterized protein n=1 Tax=Trichonephila clavata TaxID=2740835 RepID=A0A8X6KVG8_TRICU|nr:hypothetical protein TNCT_300931 [Trichonephila clavata]